MAREENDCDAETDPTATTRRLCDRLAGIKCINMSARGDKWEQVQRQARRVGREFAQKLERFEAMDGAAVLRQQQQQLFGNDVNLILDGAVQLEWDATQNAQYSSRVTASTKRMTPGEVGCALSHVHVWRDLVDQPGLDDDEAWLVLEDDCDFAGTRSRGQSQPRFVPAFGLAWEQLPEHWDLLYLGFSSRGERTYVEAPNSSVVDDSRASDLQVQLYRPAYGFHTHAYVVKRRAAKILLEKLPVVGPIDVWLADNGWWGLDVYCAVIANEGWQREDGTFEGSNLVSQQKSKYSSDVQPSSVDYSK
jgi:GR25 family glycosyltransferase involved in LPS biosynthesis